MKGDVPLAGHRAEKHFEDRVRHLGRRLSHEVVVVSRGVLVAILLVASIFAGGCSRCEFHDFPSYHEGMNALACAPHAPLAVTGSGRGTLKVWDVAGHVELATVEDVEEVQAVAFSPNGKHLVSGGRWLVLWDSATWKERLRFPTSCMTFALAFSPEGNTVLTGHITGEIGEWDVHTGRKLRSLRAHHACVSTIAVCPKGDLLATGDADGNICVSRLRALEEISRAKGHVSFVCSLAFSQEGTLLASGGDDGALRIWEPRQLRELACWRAHEGWVKAVVFSPDGQYVISGGNDKMLRMWKPLSGQEVLSCQPDPHASPEFLAVSLASRRLVIGLGSVILKSMELGEHLAPRE